MSDLRKRSVVVSFWLNSLENLQLMRNARESGVTTSEYLRKLIDQDTEKRKKEKEKIK